MNNPRADFLGIASMSRRRPVFFTLLFVTFAGCASIERGEISGSKHDPVAAATSLVALEAQSAITDDSPLPVQTPADAGNMAWAQGLRGQLLRGLDGELYLPYDPVTVMLVQSALKDRGLYSGPLSGILDHTTMQSIYEFQAANLYLQRCGVPTPRTRKLLEQGAHTDVLA